MATNTVDGPEIPAQSPPKTGALTAGQVVAAAGMAVGAVLLVAAIFQNAAPSDFVEPVKTFFTNAFNGSPSAGHMLADGFSKAVVGAAAIVAGYVGYTQLGESKKAVQDAAALPPPSENKWEDRYMAEQIAVKQAMVAARNQVYFGGQGQPVPARG